jgi:hypothetical protein
LPACFAHGGRAALVAATGDHYRERSRHGSVFCRAAPGPCSGTRSLSIMGAARPARRRADITTLRPLLASYPTMLALLADERSAAARHRSRPHMVRR